jgi:hypothetical protein
MSPPGGRFAGRISGSAFEMADILEGIARAGGRRFRRKSERTINDDLLIVQCPSCDNSLPFTARQLLRGTNRGCDKCGALVEAAPEVGLVLVPINAGKKRIIYASSSLENCLAPTTSGGFMAFSVV